MKVKELIEIANYLKLNETVIELEQLEQRLQNPRTPLVLPLVGEFSAGKTSLLNALTDSKQLEVATQPTTSTIYELHFGQEKQYAAIIQKDGQEVVVESIASLDNSQLGDVPLIKIYDTSTRVPRDLVLVDTPGLSSPDQKHKDALIRFLPQADALLITVDCNQQITNSLLRFMEECKLNERKIYIVITKCDTKSASDLESIRHYISKNYKLDLEQIVCVAANTDDLSAFYLLIDQLSKNKKEVLEVSVKARVENLKAVLKENIEQLLKLPDTTEDLEKQLSQSKKEESQIMREIDSLISSVECSLKDISEELLRHYKSLLYERLERVLGQKNNDMTAEANRILYSTSSLIMKEYRIKITDILVQQASKGSFFIQTAVKRLDLENLENPEAEITIDLNNVGHERDKKIANIVQWGALAIAAVGGGVAALARGGAAIGSGMAASAKGGAALAANVQTAISVADTATDVGSMMYMKRLLRKQGPKVMAAVDMGKTMISNYNNMAQHVSPKTKGFLEGLVARVTELTAKPQRLRAIDNCIQDQIMPDFVICMQQNVRIILTELREAIQAESQQILNEQAEQIIELQNAIKAQSGEYQQRISTLKMYQTLLNS